MSRRAVVWSLALFTTLFCLFILAGRGSAQPGELTCLNPRVVDGDSINCSNLGRIRLLGIDAPDRMSSSPCRGGYGNHVCSDEGARRAKLSLQVAMNGRVTVSPVTRDRYGRMLAMVSSGGRDLSCWQISQGAARYIASYDNGRRVATSCPSYTR
jgi:endonuclease YncB( thermonuclease family)